MRSPTGFCSCLARSPLLSSFASSPTSGSRAVCGAAWGAACEAVCPQEGPEAVASAIPSRLAVGLANAKNLPVFIFTTDDFNASDDQRTPQDPGRSARGARHFVHPQPDIVPAFRVLDDGMGRQR